MRLPYVLLGVGFIIPNLVLSRPVSYPGGRTIMLMNDGNRNSAHIHYSPTARISWGYKFEYWRDKQFKLHALQMNRLLRRWNRANSQANLYLKSGVGFAHSNADSFDGNFRVAGFAGFSVDAENRRYFVSYENRYTEAGEIDNFFQQSVRFGWAPYEGDYGDLHTWLMLMVAHMPENDDNFTTTLLVRFFKGVHSLEAGMSDQGEVLLNYIFRH